MRLSIVVALFFVLLGCETSRPPDLASLGCGKDTDCKGTRVCESNRCVEPAMPLSAPASAVVPAVAAPLPPAAAMAKLRVNSEPDGASVREDGVEICSTTPCDIVYKDLDADPTRVHRLTFSQAGYRSATRAVSLADSPVSVTLVAAR